MTVSEDHHQGSYAWGGGQAQAKIAEETMRQPKAPQLVRLVHTTGQIGLAGGHPTPPVRSVPRTGQTDPRALRRQRTFKPKSLEKGR
jgi:hypothetical protein